MPPISGEYYLVSIDSTYFSMDGTGAGAACLTKVDGLDKLFLSYQGVTRIPINGLPFNFIRENTAFGIHIVTKPFVVSETVLDALKTAVNTVSASGDALAVVVAGGPGAVNVDCDPFWEGGEPPLRFTGDFFDDNLYNVELHLVTRGFTAP